MLVLNTGGIRKPGLECGMSPIPASRVRSHHWWRQCTSQGTPPADSADTDTNTESDQASNADSPGDSDTDETIHEERDSDANKTESNMSEPDTDCDVSSDDVNERLPLTYSFRREFFEDVGQVEQLRDTLPCVVQVRIDWHSGLCVTVRATVPGVPIVSETYSVDGSS